MGVQLLHGKLPGVDILTHYGPMVFYSSAAWYWLSGSLLGETIACAAAYALCLTIIYALLAACLKAGGPLRRVRPPICSKPGLKWYIWLFPLGTIWLLDQVSRATHGSQANDRGNGTLGRTGLALSLGRRHDRCARLSSLLYLTRGELSFTVRVPWRRMARPGPRVQCAAPRVVCVSPV